MGLYLTVTDFTLCEGSRTALGTKADGAASLKPPGTLVVAGLQLHLIPEEDGDF